MAELRHFALFSLALSAIAIILGIGLRVFRPQDFREHAALFWAFLMTTAASGFQAAVYVETFLPDSWVPACRWAALFAQWIAVLWLLAVLLTYFVRRDYSRNTRSFIGRARAK